MRSIMKVVLACLAGFFSALAFAAAPAHSTNRDRPADGLPVYLPLVARQSIGAGYTIILWENWGGDYEQAYLDALSAYQAANSHIHLQVVQLDDPAGALVSAVPAGVGPDLIAWANDHIGWAAQQGLITPLDAWVSQTDLIGAFELVAAKGMIWGGQVWGLPDRQEGVALVYNRALINDAQLPDPDSFADLQSKAIQFESAHPGMTYVCNQGLGNLDAYHVAPIFFGFGLKAYGGYIDEVGHSFLTSTAAVSASQWIYGFRPYAPPVTSHQICRDILVNGQAAIWWTGPWAIADIANAGIDYGIAPMGDPFVGVKNYSLTPNAVQRGNAEVAVGIMQYMGSAAVQKNLALTNGTIPANSAALHDPAVQTLYPVAAFGVALERGVPMGNGIYTYCQWDPVGNAVSAIWDGSQTPLQAMQTAQDAIQACVQSSGP